MTAEITTLHLLCVKVTSQAVLVIVCKVLLLFLLLVLVSTEQSSDMDAFVLSVTVPMRSVTDGQCLASQIMHASLVDNAVAPVASQSLTLAGLSHFHGAGKQGPTWLHRCTGVALWPKLMLNAWQL